MDTPDTSPDLRDRAVSSLKRKQAFKQSLVSYVAVNVLMVAIWALTGGGYFWPAWVMGGWGLGLAMQGYNAYGASHGISETEVSQEMARLGAGQTT
jgi:hypothetical protein